MSCEQRSQPSLLLLVGAVGASISMFPVSGAAAPTSAGPTGSGRSPRSAALAQLAEAGPPSSSSRKIAHIPCLYLLLQACY